MACLHVLLSQGSHVLQTFEPTVFCSSLRLVSVDSAAVSLLTRINKTDKCFNPEWHRQLMCACSSVPYLAHHGGNVMPCLAGMH